MNQDNNYIYCKPGEKIPEEIINKLKEANSHFTKSRCFPKYLKAIEEIFKLTPPKITTDGKFFIAGFIEGEGSINVSCKKSEKAKFGLLIDPEFSITQHVNGVQNLYNAMVIFQAGRLHYKTDSLATLVLTIDNRRTIEEKVFPFWGNYIIPYSSHFKQNRFYKFKKLMSLFNAGCHTDLKGFVDQILPIWDSMRMQRGQINESFASLEDAQNYARNFKGNKQK
jgi:hypothetical protein